jgi:hypothetical protein
LVANTVKPALFATALVLHFIYFRRLYLTLLIAAQQMDSQPKIRPEWVPEAYKEQGGDRSEAAKPAVKAVAEKTGFKRMVTKTTPRKINPGGGKVASTGGLDRKPACRQAGGDRT